MILDAEHWMELRRFRPLFEAGVVTIAEVARASGRDWRTVKKYLTAEASSAPAAPRAGGSGDQPWTAAHLHRRNVRHVPAGRPRAVWPGRHRSAPARRGGGHHGRDDPRYG